MRVCSAPKGQTRRYSVCKSTTLLAMDQVTAAVRFDKAGVSGFLHRPAGAQSGLVLTHGAGANCHAPSLVAVAGALASAGVCVLRCDFPFMVAALLCQDISREDKRVGQ